MINLNSQFVVIDTSIYMLPRRSHLGMGDVYKVTPSAAQSCPSSLHLIQFNKLPNQQTKQNGIQQQQQLFAHRYRSRRKHSQQRRSIGCWNQGYVFLHPHLSVPFTSRSSPLNALRLPRIYHRHHADSPAARALQPDFTKDQSQIHREKAEGKIDE